jgi:hypothetical protein
MHAFHDRWKASERDVCFWQGGFKTGLYPNTEGFSCHSEKKLSLGRLPVSVTFLPLHCKARTIPCPAALELCGDSR